VRIARKTLDVTKQQSAEGNFGTDAPFIPGSLTSALGCLTAV
jgi:hypothetical protein